jgi:hypothetical protein
MSPEFENLLTLLYSTDKANRLLGLQIATNYQAEFEAHFECKLSVFEFHAKNNAQFLVKTLQEFAHYELGKMYDPLFSDSENSSGWRTLKEMVLNKVTKHTLEEYYQYFFHTLLRPLLIKHWSVIRLLRVEPDGPLTEKQLKQKYPHLKYYA